MIEDLLSAMVGIEGKYVCVRRGRHKEGNSFYYQLEPSLDASLSVSFSGFSCFWNSISAIYFMVTSLRACECVA